MLASPSPATVTGRGSTGNEAAIGVITPAQSSDSHRGAYRPEGFIAASSVMSYNAVSETITVHDGLPPRIVQGRDVIVRATQADILPAPVLRKALVDAFVDHVHPYVPVVDPSDLSDQGTSVLLQQAVCLVGSLMRHDQSSLQLSYSLYEKVKTLVHVDFERDDLALLKTFCLMSCWSPASPYLVTLHGPWHWTGMAVRLAIQMGVHTQSTYAEKDNAGCFRRIFWHLHVCLLILP